MTPFVTRTTLVTLRMSKLFSNDSTSRDSPARTLCDPCALTVLKVGCLNMSSEIHVATVLPFTAPRSAVGRPCHKGMGRCSTQARSDIGSTKNTRTPGLRSELQKMTSCGAMNNSGFSEHRFLNKQTLHLQTHSYRTNGNISGPHAEEIFSTLRMPMRVNNFIHIYEMTQCEPSKRSKDKKPQLSSRRLLIPSVDC